MSLAALAACESRDIEYRYVPPEVQARGPNAPFPVPEPADKPDAAYPIDVPPPVKAAVGVTTLDDVPGGGTAAPPPKRPSYGGNSYAPSKAAKPVSPAPSAPGGVLVGRTVTVQQGDTVYAIARRHGVNAREIIELNGLQPPFTLKIGQKLKIPGGDHHSVVPGDTLYNISRRYSVDIPSLMAANGIDESRGIVIGQILVIPARSGDTLEPATSVADVLPAAASGAAGGSALAGGFIWPVRGKVISTFGDKKGGMRNDGINILVSRGTEVLAAAPGTVAYAGNELRGFGNLILLRHDRGWVSAYAHNDDILVRQGQAVNRGAVIARAGASGLVSKPQLHFELRQGAKAVNPAQFLPPV
ncbi:LysM peptidoglycan-binding domain-containing protein [Emcibacter sp. SYSU 3D8]|uniref:LysM peptidoglycan-binding domain-containing protein n=1 Tax=Emcibacter sp. SYSU 3D8 TaxID=3133969 RepID=UPI0031FF3869